MENKNMDVEKIKESIRQKLEDNFGCSVAEATQSQLYYAIARTVRDEVMRRRTASRGVRRETQAKKLYYLSAEYLVGRTLHSNVVNLVNEENYAQALKELGIDRDAIFEEEPEPGLGNGGLGRLAACFLDSLSSMNLPAMGCTIRYEYGLFRQKIVDGYQVEVPDNWLDEGNLWEIPRPEHMVEVHFGGWVEQYGENGKLKFRHHDYSTVEAIPYDIPSLGYDTNRVNMLRTWSARSPKRINIDAFNKGEYVRAMAERELAEVISKVLYPNDDSYQGRELRLKQQYFFSSASVQYAIRDFLENYGAQWNIFPDKVAIHINDTHPGVAIPEMMRVLMDEYGLDWDTAEDICRRTFAYTNHTVMQEALERWEEGMFKKLLPRIYMILEEMNRRLCARLWDVYPGQWERIGHMAILAYGQIHMANLCVAYSHHVNGVSAIHTDILKKQTFHDYYVMDPSRFVSVTNGITIRRWLMQANPELAKLLDEAIGQAWRKDWRRIEDAVPFAEDAAFREKFNRVKQANKEYLSKRVAEHEGVPLDPNSIFFCQAKRLHEYKRQLMNILGVLMEYNKIAENPEGTYQPRTYLFAAKASPAYTTAKLIIKLIHAVSELIKKHPVASKYLRVVFWENYSVSSAEKLIPASDVSVQISTAGKEASGTGNMKFMLNGGVTLGTMDGANCEIYDAVGANNIYIFGLTAEQVDKGYQTYRSADVYEENAEIRHAMEQLIDGTLCAKESKLFTPLYRSLLFGDGGMADSYFVLKDLQSMLEAENRLCKDFQNRDEWLKKAIINTAKAGFFSSDRTIAEYNDNIWHLKPLNL